KLLFSAFDLFLQVFSARLGTRLFAACRIVRIVRIRERDHSRLQVRNLDARTLARMPAAHDEFLSRARLLGLRKAGNLELRVLALVYHSDRNLLLLDCLPDKVVKLIRHLGDEHLRAFRNNHGLFRSGVRLLNFRCARCLRHWLLANRQRNKDQNKNAAQQYFFHSFFLAPDYSVIFFLMCFAQASPALCLPRTEFVLFTEYAKMTEPVLRFTILMLAVSLV